MEKMKGINKMARETKAIKITRKIKYQSIRIPILLTMVAKVRILDWSRTCIIYNF